MNPVMPSSSLPADSRLPFRIELDPRQTLSPDGKNFFDFLLSRMPKTCEDNLQAAIRSFSSLRGYVNQSTEFSSSDKEIYFSVIDQISDQIKGFEVQCAKEVHEVAQKRFEKAIDKVDHPTQASPKRTFSKTEEYIPRNGFWPVF